MIRLRLVVKKKSDDVLRLTLSQGFRFFFFGLALFLVIFFVMDLKEHPQDNILGPLIFIAFFLLAGSYKEEWLFIRSQAKVESRFGLIFLFQRRSISLEDIEAFRIMEFVKGSQQTPAPGKRHFFQIAYSKFTLATKQGLLKDIEIVKNRFRSELEKKGEQVAKFCQKKLEK